MKRGTLNHDLVIDQALKIVSESGFDQLTYNGLARTLGVVPQSLYRYVDNIADVKSGVIAAYINQLTDSLYQELVPFSGKEALRQLADYFVAYTRTGIAVSDMISGLVSYRQTPDVLNAVGRLHTLAMQIMQSITSASEDVAANVDLFLNFVIGSVTLVTVQTVADHDAARQKYLANVDRILTLID